MNHIFGDVADTAPEGFLPRRVHFTTLVRLDEPTVEGILTRSIASGGFGARTLPLPITARGENGGHYNAVVSGRLDKVAIDGHNVEGWGWATDDEDGRKAYAGLALKTARGNSIEMTDAKYRMEINFPENEDDDVSVDITFTQANIGVTTLVLKPAFASAAAELEEIITASMTMEGDLEVDEPFEVVWPETEMTAATTIVYPHDAFTVPEPVERQTVRISRDGRFVSGHLGTWDSVHTGWMNKSVRIPRSRSNYASFCKNAIPTDQGTAYTGPVILLGGHEATSEAINKAAADVKNCWADIVVIDGILGPWFCGVVRPGISDEALAAARGSRVSGHWVRDELFAICSVNAEGFDVPRTARYVVETNEHDEVEYLAASFAVEEAPDEAEEFAAFGPHSSATVTGTWDAGAQEKNVTSPNTLGYFGRIYAWQKPGAKATGGKYAKTDMGFPHHMVAAGGAPGAANLTGCSAAIGRLNSGNGGADRQGIYNHVAAHLRAGGQEPPKLLSLEEIDGMKSSVDEILAEIDAVLEDD